MTKKIITLFFLLLFITQILPLQQVGKIIAGATMTEELPDAANAKSKIDYADVKWLPSSDTFASHQGTNSKIVSYYIHFSETLPYRLMSDVQTPPPDIFC
jgi:hypothetical protein